MPCTIQPIYQNGAEVLNNRVRSPKLDLQIYFKLLS